MTSYVFQNVATDHTVAASFEPWSAPVPGGASVTPTTSAQTTQSGTGASLSIPAATVSATGASQATWSFGDGRSSTSAAAAPVSHDYDLAGAFTVLCTLTDANGATVATTTDTVTVTSGRIEVSPLQSEATARIQKATETLRDVSAADLRTLYGVADQSIQPLKKASDFVATIDQPLKPAVFRFSIYDLPLETAKLRLLKLKADGTNKEYAYASSASNDRDGRWWISDEAGYDIPITDTLAPATRYYVHFVILDNGPFDADPAPGAIHDPVTLAQSDTAASADAPSGGSGGCTAAPADQGLDLALLLLAGAGLAAMGRRLARAAVPSDGPRRRDRRP
jgi:PKD repeat protein